MTEPVATQPGASQRPGNGRGSATSGSNSVRKTTKPRTAAEAEKAASVAAARARAAEREREEWEERRGAGSDVVVWYDKHRKDEGFVKSFVWNADYVVPKARDVLARPSVEQKTANMDRLLSWGIGDYTVLPKVLGRGRFSSVFLAEKQGEKVAIKHTPLFPHHDLIATRLLREPTLLAELPPHPNLVAVKETIRTPGHFYLVEEFLEGYVTLESLVTKSDLRNEHGYQVLAPAVADRIFSQLLFALHAIHWPLRVCHRDVKPENILVHPETLQLKLLDFGLATHFSKSRPKLTTCCGSPAFYCPEMVTALTRPLGSVAYWGPEVDAWTCGLTILRCLCGLRYPLGTQHTSPQSMAKHAQQALALVQPHTLRERIALLLEMDSEKRMRNFEDLVQHYLARQKDVSPPVRKTLKSTTFITTEPQHKMPLPLLDPETQPRSSFDGQQVPSPYSELILINYTRLPTTRVLSFIKYCLRSAGILYHILPFTEIHEPIPLLSAGVDSPSGHNASYVLQCVLELPDTQPKSLFQSFMQALGFGENPPPPTAPSSSQSSPNQSKSSTASGPPMQRGDVQTLTFYMYIFFARRPSDNPPLFEPERMDDSVISSESMQDIKPLGPLPTRADTSASLTLDTLPETLERHPSRSRTRGRSRCGRGTRVRVFISDQRATPHVRKALSSGGIVEKSDLEELAALEAQTHARSRSGSIMQDTPTSAHKQRDRTLPPPLRTTLHSDDISVRLDAILRARDTAFASRERHSQDAAQHAQDLNTLVARLYLYVDATVKSTDPAAVQALQEHNFAMLEVLSPMLALVSSFDTARPQLLSDGSMLEVKTTGCLALAILETVARVTSAKEMLLGIQEQIERLCALQDDDDGDEETDLEPENSPGPPGDRHTRKIQELLGLVRLISSVQPEVRTRRIRAVVQPTLELLYPPVFRQVIAPALGQIRERELAEELATQGAMLLCEFVLGVNSRLDTSDSVVGGMLKELLIGGICSMFGSLPHTGGYSDDTSRSPGVFVPADKNVQVSWRITVWNVVRKTLEEIGLDLGVEALGEQSPDMAQNAFLLMTQQIAYESFMAAIKGRVRERLALATANSERLPEPGHWSREIALELLERIAKVTPTSLFPGLMRLDEQQGPHALAVARSSFTSDAYCTMSSWALDALDRSESRAPLGVAIAAPIVRALAVTAANAPELDLRSECFTSLSRLVRDWCTIATATQLLDEMLGADTPLAAGAVSLLRDITGKRLDASAASTENTDSNCTENDPENGPPQEVPLFGFLWQRDIFKLPSLPDTPDTLVPFLAQYTVYITECCSLYYYLYVRDVRGATGARKHYVQVKEQFLDPLGSWTTRWRDQPDAQWVGLIDIGLTRIIDAVGAHSTQ
ncbi:hypothetical protein MCUN1_000947 [Malassezia cuniculi]|uniref:Protein kinase domain-containing protein n=1 Tax=Malassezia cuniculi TaxID=948313 RepID=A0AAF0ERZ8_9BASI|nr:hypothetical protein MCUN1_000947 [Malassezia cuniculi]